jgi:hypothetical protein
VSINLIQSKCINQRPSQMRNTRRFFFKKANSLKVKANRHKQCQLEMQLVPFGLLVVFWVLLIAEFYIG